MTRRLINRRSFMGRVVGGTLAAGGAVALIRGPAWASPNGGGGVTDADPVDRVGQGERTDTDPTDDRFGGRRPVSDSDPNDPVGGGGNGPVASRRPRGETGRPPTRGGNPTGRRSPPEDPPTGGSR